MTGWIFHIVPNITLTVTCISPHAHLEQNSSGQLLRRLRFYSQPVCISGGVDEVEYEFGRYLANIAWDQVGHNNGIGPITHTVTLQSPRALYLHLLFIFKHLSTTEEIRLPILAASLDLAEGHHIAKREIAAGRLGQTSPAGASGGRNQR